MYKACSYNLTQLDKTIFDPTEFMENITPFMKKLHESDLEHLDLKPANIVYCPNNETNKYRIIDFSLTRDIKNKDSTFQMSSYYMLPTILDFYGMLKDENERSDNLKSLREEIKNTMEKYIKTTFKNESIFTVPSPVGKFVALNEFDINKPFCGTLLKQWPKKTTIFSRWIFRKADDYAIALILFDMLGPDITKSDEEIDAFYKTEIKNNNKNKEKKQSLLDEKNKIMAAATFFRELIKMAPYFDKTYETRPLDIKLSLGGARKLSYKSKGRPSLKKYKTLK